jgi:hypothetical protein
VRPVPQLEIPPSDDECVEPQSSSSPGKRSSTILRASPELPDPYGGDEGPFPEDEEPSDLDESDELTLPKPTAEAKTSKDNRAKKRPEIKAKGGYKIGKQVSGNFVSYKIRSKGQRGRGRGRFGRR